MGRKKRKVFGRCGWLARWLEDLDLNPGSVTHLYWSGKIMENVRLIEMELVNSYSVSGLAWCIQVHCYSADGGTEAQRDWKTCLYLHSS